MPWCLIVLIYRCGITGLYELKIRVDGKGTQPVSVMKAKIHIMFQLDTENLGSAIDSVSNSLRGMAPLCVFLEIAVRTVIISRGALPLKLLLYTAQWREKQYLPPTCPLEVTCGGWFPSWMRGWTNTSISPASWVTGPSAQSVLWVVDFKFPHLSTWQSSRESEDPFFMVQENLANFC